MKRAIFAILSILALSLTSLPSARAATGLTAYALVEQTATHGISPFTNWVSLTGVSSISGCGNTNVNGTSKVVFAISNDDYGKQQMSILLSALLSGRQVQVYYDTTQMSGTICRAVAVYMR